MILAAGRAFSSLGGSIRESLFWNHAYSDHFMDLFNSMRESRDLSWVYQRNVLYPPLSVLLTYLLSRLLPANAINIPFRKRYSLQLNANADTLWLILVIFSVLLFAIAAERYLRRAKLSGLRYAAVFFLTVSFPMVYCMERGNLSLPAMALCAVFVFCRNDENKHIRELSYICLALAAGLKLFPAVLGMLLLYDRKFKAAARTLLYGVAAILLPYLLILLLTPKDGGIAKIVADRSSAMVSAQSPALERTALSLLTDSVNPDGSIFRLFENLFSRIEKTRDFAFDSTSFANLVYFLAAQKLFTPETAKIVAMTVFCFTELCGAALGFFSRREWQRVFFAVFLILNIHPVAMHYTLIYLLLPLVVYLAETAREDRRAIDVPYLLLFCIQFVFLPFYTDGAIPTMRALFAFYLHVETPTSVNKLLSAPAFYLLFLAAAADVLINRIAAGRKKRRENAPEAADPAVPAPASL